MAHYRRVAKQVRLNKRFIAFVAPWYEGVVVSANQYGLLVHDWQLIEEADCPDGIRACVECPHYQQRRCKNMVYRWEDCGILLTNRDLFDDNSDIRVIKRR